VDSCKEDREGSWAPVEYERNLPLCRTVLPVEVPACLPSLIPLFPGILITKILQRALSAWSDAALYGLYCRSLPSR